MRVLVASGELAELAAERVWQELARGLMEPHPARLLAVLRECGALRELLPEVAALDGAGRRAQRGEVPAVGAARARARICGATRIHAAGPLCRPRAPVGRRRSDGRARPGHGAQAIAGRAGAPRGSRERLKVPVECRDAARLAARWHRAVVEAPDAPSCGTARPRQRRRRAASAGTPRDVAADVRVRRDVRVSPASDFAAARHFARHWTS